MTEPKRWIGDGSEVAGLLRDLDAAPPSGARERVFERMQQPRPSRSWVVPALVCASALLAALIVRESRESRETSPYVFALSAEGQVRANGRDVHGSDALPLGSLLEVGASSRLSAQVSQLGSVHLDSDSVASLSQVQGRFETRLDRGEVRLEVEPRHDRPPVVVLAGSWTVRVVGTIFEVRRFGEDVVVSVERGVVEVEGHERTRRVKAGETFDSRVEVNVSRVLPDSTPPAPPRQDPPLRTAEVSRNSKIVGPGRVLPEPSRVEGVSNPVEQRSELQPKTENVFEPGGARVQLTESEEELYGRAKVAPAADSVALFDAVARRKGPLAEVATYKAARAEMALAQHASALARLHQMRADFPSGSLRAEVGLSEIECLLVLGRTTDARASLTTFLESHPGHERSMELLYLRGKLEQQEGRCTSAVESFARVDRGPYAAESLYRRASCLQELGDLAEASQLLRQYVERYPQGGDIHRVRVFLEREKK